MLVHVHQNQRRGFRIDGRFTASKEGASNKVLGLDLSDAVIELAQMFAREQAMALAAWTLCLPGGIGQARTSSACSPWPARLTFAQSSGGVVKRGYLQVLLVAVLLLGLLPACTPGYTPEINRDSDDDDGIDGAAVDQDGDGWIRPRQNPLLCFAQNDSCGL